MTAGTNPTFPLYPGVLPGIPGDNAGTNTPPQNYSVEGAGDGGGRRPAASAARNIIWVCLRRPANLFAPVSAYNPMVVVDAMRVPYIDGTGLHRADPMIRQRKRSEPAVNAPFNTVYSVQRYQPYRGGHAVPRARALSIRPSRPRHAGPTLIFRSGHGRDRDRYPLRLHRADCAALGQLARHTSDRRVPEGTSTL